MGTDHLSLRSLSFTGVVAALCRFTRVQPGSAGFFEVVVGVGGRDGFPALRGDAGETDTVGEACIDSDRSACAVEEPELDKRDERAPERNSCRRCGSSFFSSFDEI